MIISALEFVKEQVITSLVEFSVPEFFLGLIHSDDNLSFGVFERKKVITSLNFQWQDFS